MTLLFSFMKYRLSKNRFFGRSANPIPTRGQIMPTTLMPTHPDVWTVQCGISDNKIWSQLVLWWHQNFPTICKGPNKSKQSVSLHYKKLQKREVLRLLFFHTVVRRSFWRASLNTLGMEPGSSRLYFGDRNFLETCYKFIAQWRMYNLLVDI